MDSQAGITEAGIRIAALNDIPILARHHRMMFEEILEKTGKSVDYSVLSALEKEYAGKLAREFGSGTCISWVIQDDNRIVSSGAVSIVSYVPVPHDLSTRIAFLHSIYTEKEYRHRHHAQRITQTVADYCRNRGIKRLYLVASDAGRPVYEKSGFVPVPDMMMLLQ
ncbi:MAG: GNAT family N-acetyltransferase [Methanoregulaceae archaeon]|nr:MAG: GNAT family N-acetyltransferase [Methanoregulaceae archaeon]